MNHSNLYTKIAQVLELNHFVFLWITLFGAFLFYSLFLKKISEKRHKNLKTRFRVTFILLAATSFFALLNESGASILILNYLALAGLLLGAITTIKLAQILVYLYLFWNNLGQGVPRLIGNLFSFVFSLLVFGLIASFIFEVHFATFLATSAIFSVVLGIALQDTLGNLLSGLTLQLDQPFKIGDWVEIHSDSQKWLGQIQEISWRSTYLLTYSNEYVMIPNRTISQSRMILFTPTAQTFRLSHTFRLPFDVNVQKVKDLLIKATDQTPGVSKEVPPRALLIEAAEFYLIVKIFYSIEQIAMRYRTSDQVISQCLETLAQSGISLAIPQVKVQKEQFEPVSI